MDDGGPNGPCVPSGLYDGTAFGAVGALKPWNNLLNLETLVLTISSSRIAADTVQLTAAGWPAARVLKRCFR